MEGGFRPLPSQVLEICRKSPEAKDLHLQNTKSYHELIHNDKSATPTTTQVSRGRVALFYIVVALLRVCFEAGFVVTGRKGIGARAS